MLTIILLFFIGSGLFSNSIYQLQFVLNDKEIILWELNCCDPKNNVGWDIAKGLFGWDNKATLATVISYLVYWFIVIVGIFIINFYYNDKNDSEENENENNQEQQHHNVEMTTSNEIIAQD